MVELSKKLVKLRKAKGISQLKLAELMAVSRQAVSKWESGEAVPSIENLKCISALFQVSLDYLLHDDENEYAPEEFGGANTHTPEAKANVWNDKIPLLLLILTVLLLGICFAKKQSNVLKNVSELDEVIVNTEEMDGFDLEW